MFQEKELSSSNIKKILIFSQKKAFLYFGKQKPRKISYISENGNPKKFLIFEEVTFQAREMKKKPLLKDVLYFGKRNFLVPRYNNFSL